MLYHMICNNKVKFLINMSKNICRFNNVINIHHHLKTTLRIVLMLCTQFVCRKKIEITNIVLDITPECRVIERTNFENPWLRVL